MKDLYAEIAGDAKFDQTFNGLADLPQVDKNLNRGEVIELASYVAANRLSKAMWVTIVDTSIITALAIIYEKDLNSQHPFEICSTARKTSNLRMVDLEEFGL